VIPYQGKGRSLLSRKGAKDNTCGIKDDEHVQSNYNNAGAYSIRLVRLKVIIASIRA
jgi:hypothetical protein